MKGTLDFNISLYIIYFQSIVKAAVNIYKPFQNCSWSQPVLSNEWKVSFSRKQWLATDWVWIHAASDPYITSPVPEPLDHAAIYFDIVIVSVTFVSLSDKVF